MTTALIIGSIIAAAATASATYYGINESNTKKNANKASDRLRQFSNSQSNKEFEAYLRDAMSLGYIDGNTNKNALAAYTKLRNNNYDVSKLGWEERKAVTNLYNQLYNNDSGFKSLWDKQYSQMSDDEKLKFIDGASTMGVTVPAPAYLDTSFERYQREVEPLKLYSNQELADLYNLDYNFENIKKDYDAVAQANVDYTNWLSDLNKNVGERDNVTNRTSYLDAIRNVKSEAVLNGMSNGARAAAEVLANNEAIQNKVNNNTDVATQRFELQNDALLQRARSAIDATTVYNNLAKTLASTGSTLYSNDVNRLGQDLLSNANFLAADENLGSNRQAQNNLMASIYNGVSAQNQNYTSGVNNVDWLFKNVYMPAADNNIRVALSDYIGSQYKQQTGYSDPMSKWGTAANK